MSTTKRGVSPLALILFYLGVMALALAGAIAFETHSNIEQTFLEAPLR